MKIFAIRDETDKEQKDLAYLLYYEGAKKFYIELPENADPWETPLLLSTFAGKKVHSINSYWSELWVQQRIVPTDRQNLSQILRESHLREYDPYRLLLLSRGRCAQDDYYLVPISEEKLPETIQKRFARKIEDIVPLADFRLLVFFRDGAVKLCNLLPYFAKHPEFSVLVQNPELFRNAQLLAGGFGVGWDEKLTIPDSTLYSIGTGTLLSSEDFLTFVTERVVNTQEAAEILNCSRQYINELVQNGKLHPVKATEKNTLFLKSELLRRSWQT